MPDQLAFDEATAARLERLYLSGDVRRRRQLASDVLAPALGSRLIDVGCGPGFHTGELAEMVGDAGLVVGIDVSDTMIGIARQRNAHRDNVEFRSGDASALPVADGSVDGFVAVQVLEYVNDVEEALGEAMRVLTKSGRIVVVDVDWSTVSWHSLDPERMNNVLRAWDRHLAHPTLPRHLGRQLKAAGFLDIAIQGHAFVNTNMGPDSYSAGLVPLIRDFAIDHGHTTSEMHAWVEDLVTLDAQDDYFFTVTKFVFTANKPS